MTDELRSSSSNYISERNAVAYLIKDCASAIITIYGCNGSGSISTQIALALNRRGYTHALQLVDPQIWIGRIKNNLDNDRPLIIGLGGNGGGHFVVCDGYRSDNYFHFNWGGNGYYNHMWFTMDNIYDNDGTYPNGLKDYIYSIYPKDDFYHCNYNVTLTNASQDIPKYPTNLTVNFGNTTNNTITSGQNVTYFSHNSIVIKPGFHAKAGSYFHAYIDPCADCGLPTIRSILFIEDEDTDDTGDNEQDTMSIYPKKLLQEEATPQNKEITLYPNPNTGSFTVIGEDIKGIEVFNFLGQSICNVQNPATLTINLPNGAKGIFFVRVTTSNESVVKKMVVQ
jgi:hypothetical protein